MAMQTLTTIPTNAGAWTITLLLAAVMFAMAVVVVSFYAS